MIFNYTYITHEAEKLQALARHIVVDVWCNASGVFDIELLLNDDSDPDCFRKKVNRTSTYLKQPIIDIFDICTTFSQAQKDFIQEVFIKNNNIEQICNNTITPIFYEELERNTSAVFANKAKTFFNNLYEQVFGGKPYYINEHYNNFFQINKRLCPTCGLTTLEKDATNHRDDYDHYLPKDSYPFTAVNLNNLMVICSDCNKKWKKIKSPVFHSGGVKKAFYYYGVNAPNVNIQVVINNWETCDVEVLLSSDTMQDEVDSWNYLYSISQRYGTDVICHDDVGQGWFREIKGLMRDPSFDINTVISAAKNEYYANKNFIKAPFLEACKEKDLFIDEGSILLTMLLNEFLEETV